MVLGQGLGLAVIGIAAGVYGAMVLTRHMEALLFGVSPADPTVFVAAALVVLGIALFASYLPAHRAGTADPLDALRHD